MTTTTRLPEVYIPHYKLRTLRVIGLRAVEFGSLLVALGAGGACVLAERIHLHRPAEALAVVAEFSADLTDQASDRVNELGADAPHRWLLTMYYVLGGEQLDAALGAMGDPPSSPPAPGRVEIEAVVEVDQAEELTPEQLDQAEADVLARIDALLDQFPEAAAAGRASGELLLDDAGEGSDDA